MVIFVVIWGKTKVNVINKWLNYLMRFLMERYQSGVRQHEFLLIQNKNWDLVFRKKQKKPSNEEENWQEKLGDEFHKPVKWNFTR